MLETSDEEKVDVKSNVVIFRFFLGKVPIGELVPITLFSYNPVWPCGDCTRSLADHLPDKCQLLGCV